METSKEIKKCLKEGVVSKEMLGMALYSYNKRAKNMRDKEREYRDYARSNYFYHDKYDNEGKTREKKEEYYRKKEELLKYLQPCAIHHIIRYKNVKIYDYEDGYDDIDEEVVLYENSYYDREIDDRVYFKVVSEEFVEKYLFFELGDYSFHTPLVGDESQYNLPVEELEDFETFGKDIEDLMSVQMCDKIRLGLRDGSLSYVGEEMVAVAA